MVSLVIVGAGKGGTNLLKALSRIPQVRIGGVVDKNKNAPGMILAREMSIPTATACEVFLHNGDIQVVIEATGDPEVPRRIAAMFPKVRVLDSSLANLMMSLVENEQRLIVELTRQQNEMDVILNSTHDALIAVNARGEVTIYNSAAERLIGLPAKDVLGRPAAEVIPNTRLHHILATQKEELNQRQVIGDITIITNRVPVRDRDGNILGAVAVFRDISEVTALAEEITNLREIREMLSAIINATQDAISVVDERGIGLLVNPAYTRLTGYTTEQVVGKPATVDIAEGESMHLKVLQTRQPVWGVPMKVGPSRKEVIVNVAPIIVDGKLKGSVGVIHDISEIKQLSDELERARHLIRRLEAKYTFNEIIGQSAPLLSAVEQAKLAANIPATVLLRGESGTGKELFAHAIHHASPRRFGQFIRVNCAALADNLLESELFGYEEGAFTGAKKGGKKGLFEEAHKGTLFLDEIGEISLNLQAKLLRVLQEKEVVRVGGTKPIPADVRVIAATNADLEEAIREGRFRKDLYYRLSVLPIFIPSLRERKEDIPLLANYLIRKLNQEYGRSVRGIEDETLRVLCDYHWPGNVRELENVLGRAMIHMRFNEEVIRLKHLPPLPDIVSKQVAATFKEEDNETLEEKLQRVERQIISEVLHKVKGNKTEAARRLGISLRTLYYKMERAGIQ